jgi:hypothetical protein
VSYLRACVKGNVCERIPSGFSSCFVMSGHILKRSIFCQFSSRIGLSSVVTHLCAPNTIANVRHALLYECAVRSMLKKLKLSSDSGDFGSKKCKRSGGAYCGMWRSLLLTGVWCQAVSFSAGVFSRNLVSVAVKIFFYI